MEDPDGSVRSEPLEVSHPSTLSKNTKFFESMLCVIFVVFSENMEFLESMFGYGRTNGKQAVGSFLSSPLPKVS